MLEFRDFDVKDRELVQSHTLQLPYMNCDLAFANLFVWKFVYNTQICTHGDFLYVHYWANGKPYFMPPLGSGDLRQAFEVLFKFHEENSDLRFCLQGISELMKNRIEELYPDKFSFISKREYTDYVYLRESLITLSGKKLQPKRNHVNQFRRNYPDYRFVPITPELIPLCLDFEKRWYQHNTNDEMAQSLTNEQRAIKNGLENFTELGLQGGALIVGDEIVAFTYGSPINQTTFDVAVEKANPDFVGSYATINQEFARSIPEQYIYINREEDLGIEGLRKAKLSYQPHELLHKFTAHIAQP